MGCNRILSCFRSIFRFDAEKSCKKTVPKAVPDVHVVNRSTSTDDSYHVHDHEPSISSPNRKLDQSSTPTPCSSNSRTNTKSNSKSPTDSASTIIGDLIPPVWSSDRPEFQKAKKTISWSHFNDVIPISALRRNNSRVVNDWDRKGSNSGPLHPLPHHILSRKHYKKDSPWTSKIQRRFNSYSRKTDNDKQNINCTQPRGGDGDNKLRCPRAPSNVIEKTKLDQNDAEIEYIYNSFPKSIKKNSWIPGDRIYFYDTNEIGEIIERGLRGPRHNLVLKVRYLNRDSSTPNRVSIMSLLHAMCYGDLLCDTEVVQSYKSLVPALSWTQF